MAIGDTINPGLMRVDPSPIERAGQAQGASAKAVGDTIAQGIDRFFVNKANNESADMQIGALFDVMTPERQAMVAEGEGELGKALKKFNDGELTLSGKKALLGNMMLVNESDRLEQDRKRQESMDALNKTLASMKIAGLGDDMRRRGELEDATKGLNRFLMTSPEVRPLGEDEFGPPAPPDLQVDPPIVDMLPESYKDFGREVAAEVERGELDPTVAGTMLQNLRAEALKNRMTPEEMLRLQMDIAKHGSDMTAAGQRDLGFSQDQKLKTFDPRVNVVTIGDQSVPISGIVGDKAEAIKFKQIRIPKFNNMQATFGRLLELAELSKDEFYTDNIVKQEAQSLVLQLQGQMREDILGPGTVTDSERAMLDLIITNPTKFWAGTSEKERISLLTKLRTQLQDKFKDSMTQMGLRLGDQSSGGQGGSTVTTSTGNTVKIVNLDQ